MADNKWSKPSNPPPPLFFGEKERDLVKQVNDELIGESRGSGNRLFGPFPWKELIFTPFMERL